MLHSAKALDRFRIAATDGDLGHVEDVYFDDEKWTIRYLVVDTGGWLTGRNVVISPMSVTAVDMRRRAIRVNLTRQQVEDSPGMDTAQPVTRRHEAEFHNYYGYPYYWSGPYVWGATMFPGFVEQTPFDQPEETEQTEQTGEQLEDPHLRSVNDVIGYSIQATDDEVGHVDDFLFDERDWSIQLMVVDTRNWWPGKHVMISPRRITGVSWEDRSVIVDATREQIEHSPEYDEMHPPERDAQSEMYQRSVPDH